MVKYFSVLLVLVTFAAPAFAQDITVDIALGYGNINVEDSGRHSGFTSHQAINLNSWLAIENFIGFYGFGTDPTFGKAQLFTDIFGGKFTYRTSKIEPYVVAGFGGGWIRFPDSGVGTNNSMAARFGGGVDIPFKESLAWKIDVSRTSFHFNGWNSGTNISTGIVLKLGGL